MDGHTVRSHSACCVHRRRSCFINACHFCWFLSIVCCLGVLFAALIGRPSSPSFRRCLPFLQLCCTRSISPFSHFTLPAASFSATRFSRFPSALLCTYPPYEIDPHASRKATPCISNPLSQLHTPSSHGIKFKPIIIRTSYRPWTCSLSTHSEHTRILWRHPIGTKLIDGLCS